MWDVLDEEEMLIPPTEAPPPYEELENGKKPPTSPSEQSWTQPTLEEKLMQAGLLSVRILVTTLINSLFSHVHWGEAISQALGACRHNICTKNPITVLPIWEFRLNFPFEKALQSH